MILHFCTIPSAFERLDDAYPCGVNQFANVRNLQRAYLNHNKLIASRVRRNILTARLTDGGLNASDDTFSAKTMRALSTGLSEQILRAPITVSQVARNIELVVYARNGGTVDLDLVANVYPFYEPRPINTGYSITVTGSSTLTKYSLEIPIEKEAPLWRGGQRYVFELYAQGWMSSSDSKGATAITDVGPNWISASGLGSYVGKAAYITTDSSIEPRLISYAVGSNKVYLASPWNKMPIPGTDTVAARTVGAINLHSVALYELAADGVLAILERGPL